MKILLNSYCKVLTVIFFITSFAWSENVLSQEWRDSFHRYSYARKIIAPDGFILKSAPSVNASTLSSLFCLV